MNFNNRTIFIGAPAIVVAAIAYLALVGSGSNRSPQTPDVPHAQQTR
jgi:hypothetical protein